MFHNDEKKIYEEIIHQIKNNLPVTYVEVHALLYLPFFDKTSIEEKKEILLIIVKNQSSFFWNFWQKVYDLHLPIDILKELMLTAINRNILIENLHRNPDDFYPAEIIEAFLSDIYIATLGTISAEKIPFGHIKMNWPQETITHFFVRAVKKDSSLIHKIPFQQLSPEMIKEILIATIKSNAEMSFRYIIDQHPFEKYKLPYPIKKEICLELIKRNYPILDHIIFDKYDQSPNFFITTLARKDQHEPDHFVTVQMAQKNPDYWLIVKNVFKHQAAAIFQKYIKKIPAKKARQKPYIPLSLPTGSVCSVNELLRETHDIDAINQIVLLIEHNQWEKLNFREDHFKLKIWEAFRLELLTEKLAITAMLLHDAAHCFNQGRSITQHDLDHYDLNQISYATDEAIQNFQNLSSQLNTNEKNYFSIDFSKKNEAMFLMKGLMRKLNLFNSIFEKGLRLFLTRQTKAGYLLDCLAQRNLSPIYQLFDKIVEDGNSAFYVALLTVNEQLPAVDISPNYNPADPDSPIFCHILPALSAFEKLSEAMHGKDYIQYQATIGQIMPRQLTDLVFFNKRLGELEYPGIDRLINPHTFDNVSAFLLAWHDLYFHCWRNSANMSKDIIKYIIHLIKTEKKCLNNKSIWLLTDLDLNAGQRFRTAVKEDPTLPPYYPLCFLREYLNCASEFLPNTITINSPFFIDTDKHDSHLLIMIDMIIHAAKWKDVLGRTPQAMFFSNDYISHDKVNKGYYDNFKKVINELIKIIHHFKNQSIKFYILAYRLYTDKNKNLIKLKTLFDRLLNVDFDLILDWKVNEGLYFIDDEIKTDINKISYDELFARLESAIKLIVKLDPIISTSELGLFAQQNISPDQDKAIIKFDI